MAPMEKQHNLLYNKDFYTASNFCIKIFNFSKKSEAAPPPSAMLGARANRKNTVLPSLSGCYRLLCTHKPDLQTRRI